ncbi:hypothetical protein TRP8649_04536 [Pelagimonas phthalicica]|jgi:hypothetical protein|uniref:Uncharacterized protein n=3 Tax=Rhodobacterales TaxID=204455 RepID=A0A1L9NZG9_9RHOB|nr:hypothetical protein PFRI_11950 [Planktotalea frisia]TDS88712.1 hypothetical protein CLV87_4525 [Pelagimonas phthalicica]UOA29850.1 hypothetical protein DSM107133_04612 [Pseudosulfitobacter sp. DSM 107133]CUJ42076.1 hypothetical protein TA5113_03274 [Cognatishimia activa]PZX35676.1 hypothetical protein LY10_00060 [Planktotalea frisia]
MPVSFGALGTVAKIPPPIGWPRDLRLLLSNNDESAPNDVASPVVSCFGVDGVSLGIHERRSVN